MRDEWLKILWRETSIVNRTSTFKSSRAVSAKQRALVECDYVDCENMATSSAGSRSISRGNFYSSSANSRTPSPPSGHRSRTSPDAVRSSSSSSSSSTPLSSRDSVNTLQQVIAGLAACQSSIQDLLKTVESSNERIEDLSERMKTLDDKVAKLSSDPVVNADRGGNNERGVKRKRTKASLLIQVGCFRKSNFHG